MATRTRDGYDSIDIRIHLYLRLAITWGLLLAYLENHVTNLECAYGKDEGLIVKIMNKKHVGIAVAAAVFCCICLITFLLPKTYQSNLKVLLKNERVNTIVSSDDRAEGLYYLDQVSEARINTESELMRSLELLRDVATKSGLVDKEPAGPQSRRIDMAVGKLQRDLKISPVRRSNLIEASYVSRDPKLSAKVMQVLMNEYLDLHLRLHSAPGAALVFSQMAEGYGRDRDIAQAKLDAFKKVHSIASLPDEKALALQRVADLSKQFSDVEVALKRSQNERNQIKTFISSLPSVVEKERRSVPNQFEIEQLNIALVNLQNKRVEASARYQPTDLMIKDLDRQIELTQNALAKAKNANTEEVSTERNSLHVTAQNDYMKADTEIAGLSRQYQEIQRQFQASQQKVNELDGQTAAYNSLNRELNRLSELSQTYEKKASDVQANELLDQQRVANVAVVETPTEPSLAISPKRSLILAIGFIWSLIIGAVAALITNLAAKRIQSPYDLELLLNAPIVGFLQEGAMVSHYDSRKAIIYRSLQREYWRDAGRLS
jgi:uncharacterized protein involved in exopolysaccharide biosynthesis